MEEFLRYAVGHLVDFPEDIVVTRTESGNRLVLHLVVNPSDVSRVIGKGGHTIQSLRTLIAASGSKKRIKATLELVE